MFECLHTRLKFYNICTTWNASQKVYRCICTRTPAHRLTDFHRLRWGYWRYQSKRPCRPHTVDRLLRIIFSSSQTGPYHSSKQHLIYSFISLSSTQLPRMREQRSMFMLLIRTLTVQQNIKRISILALKSKPTAVFCIFLRSKRDHQWHRVHGVSCTLFLTGSSVVPLLYRVS